MWYIYIGLIVAVGFFFHMLPWAKVGDQLTGGGTIKLMFMLPVVIVLWPAALYMLLTDR